MKAVLDLLEKKGSIYSDRPTFTMVGELMGLGQVSGIRTPSSLEISKKYVQSMPLLPAGEEWRAHRKLAHVALSATSVKRYHTKQEDLAAIMCKEIM